jgi:hypothetical protein
VVEVVEGVGVLVEIIVEVRGILIEGKKKKINKILVGEH